MAGWKFVPLNPAGSQRRIGDSFIVDDDDTIHACVRFPLNVQDSRGSFGIGIVDLDAEFSMPKADGVRLIVSGFKPGARFSTDEAGLKQLAEVVLDGLRDQVRKQAVTRTPWA